MQELVLKIETVFKEDKSLQMDPVFRKGNIVIFKENHTAVVMVIEDTRYGDNDFRGVTLYDDYFVGHIGSIDNDFLKAAFKQYKGAFTIKG